MNYYANGNYIMKKILVLSAFIMAVFCFTAITWPVNAQNALPKLPAPIQDLVDKGAQIRYLGREHGFDAWITIKGGQEQYFYVQPDGKSFVMGLLFNDKGTLITVEQVQRLRSKGDTLLDSLASDFGTLDGRKTSHSQFEQKSPSEQLFSDIENSNWIPFGAPGAPVAYSFIRPQCPHCHSMINDLRKENYMRNGKLQLRMIMVGDRDDEIAQAAFLLAAPNPQERLFRFIDGDASAIPAKSEINKQGVQRNLAIMQSWKFDVTPMIIYRSKDGSVKIIRGKPGDLQSMISDIGARS